MQIKKRKEQYHDHVLMIMNSSLHLHERRAREKNVRVKITNKKINKCGYIEMPLTWKLPQIYTNRVAFICSVPSKREKKGEEEEKNTEKLRAKVHTQCFRFHMLACEVFCSQAQIQTYFKIVWMFNQLSMLSFETQFNVEQEQKKVSTEILNERVWERWSWRRRRSAKKKQRKK